MSSNSSYFSKIVSFCGTAIPPDFTSSGTELFIKFYSDIDTTSTGFALSYEAFTRHCSISVCKEGEGDCRLDSDCEGPLVCGQMNCANSTWQHCCTQSCHNDSDCTISGECDTESNQCRLNSDIIDWSWCSQDSPCADGEGDCDHHLDCEGALLCGIDNCASGPIGMDCCTDHSN